MIRKLYIFRYIDFPCVVQINVGKMEQPPGYARGVQRRNFGTRNVFVHKDCSYERLLEKCRNVVYPGDAEGSYYIADSSGVCIGSESTIKVDKGDGTECEVPWTLATYIKLSHMKYLFEGQTILCESDSR